MTTPVLTSHECLVALFKVREEHDPLTAAYAYVQGRIDQHCEQNAIADDAREIARLEAVAR